MFWVVIFRVAYNKVHARFDSELNDIIAHGAERFDIDTIIAHEAALFSPLQKSAKIRSEIAKESPKDDSIFRAVSAHRDKAKKHIPVCRAVPGDSTDPLDPVGACLKDGLCLLSEEKVCASAGWYFGGKGTVCDKVCV